MVIFGVLRLLKLLRLPEDKERVGLEEILLTPYVPQLQTPEPAYTAQTTPSVSGSVYGGGEKMIPRVY